MEENNDELKIKNTKTKIEYLFKKLEGKFLKPIFYFKIKFTFKIKMMKIMKS